MKKIALLFGFMTLFVFANAQLATTYIGNGDTYANYTTNTTLTNAVAQYWLIKAPQDYYTAQTVVVNLDSLAGNHTNVEVALYGRVSDQVDWTLIGSAVDWAGTTSDTTIVITNATENLYRDFKLLFTGTGTGTTTIDRMEFKQYFGTP